MSQPEAIWESRSLADWGVSAEPGFASGKHNSAGTGITHLRPMNIDRDGRLDFGTVKSVDPNVSTKRIEAGDILFNNTNSPELVGKTAVFEQSEPLAFSNHMTRLRVPAESVDPKFLAIRLHTLWRDGYFKQICSNHVNQASVSTKTLLEVVVAMPPLDVQQRIVETLEDHLSRLDKAVSELDVAEAELGSLRKSLFSRWFGGVNGEVTTLETVAEVQLGRQRSPQHHNGDRMRPYLRAANVKWHGLDLTDVASMNFSDKEMETYRLVSGDILVNEASGSASEVGKPVVFRGEIADCGFQNHLIRVRPRNRVTTEFLYYFLMGNALSGVYVAESQGIGINHLGKAKLAKWELTLPSLDAQAELVGLIEATLAALGGLEKHISEARRYSASLRRSLLQAAFSGQLTNEVPND